MRAWLRSPVSFTCGLCGKQLPQDSPMLRLYLGTQRLVKIRCQECADEPCPELPVQAGRQPGLRLTQVDEDGIERPIPQGKAPEPIRRPFVDFSERLLGEK